MKENEFLDGISNIESDVVERFVAMDMKQALMKKKKPGKRAWVKWASLAAACIALIVCAVPIMMSSDATPPDVTPPDVPDVPYILSFDSFESIGELKSMLEKDDTTVDEYLKSKQYHMNGLTSKDDIDRLFDDIGDLSMLHMDPASGYTLAGITYYVSYNYIMSTYKNGADIIRFICYIDDAAELQTDVIGSISIGNETVGLHRVEDKNSPFALASSVKTTNSYITILFSEDEIDTIQNTISGNIIFSTLLSFVEK